MSIPFVRRHGGVRDRDLPGAVGIDCPKLRSEVLDRSCDDGLP